MSNWSSFENDKAFMDAWRSYLKEGKPPSFFWQSSEEEEPTPEEDSSPGAERTFGLTSKQPDSLISILGELGFLTPEQLQTIVSKFTEIADDEGVVLEAVSLKGATSEQDRIFSPESTGQILQLISTLGLQPDQQKQLLKAINYWGRVNTVKFSIPTATPAAVAPPVSTKPPSALSLTDDPPPHSWGTRNPEDTAPGPEDLVVTKSDEEVDEEKDEEKAEEAKQKLDKAIEKKDEGGMLAWGNKWLRWNPLTGSVVGFANGIEFFKKRSDMPFAKRALGALILMAGTTLDSFAWDMLDDKGFELMAEGNYVEGVVALVGREYEKFMRFAGACDTIAPVVCSAKIWGSISAALVTAATAAGGGIASWATGGGMAAFMLAIPSIVCPMSLIYEMLPKEDLPNLDNMKEFADDPYFKAGYEADTKKKSIRILVAGAESRVKDGFGLKGKELVKPKDATNEQKKNYTKYLLGLKAQQALENAIEGIQTKLAGLAKKKSDAEEAPEADAAAEEAPAEKAVAVQQEHMIYERWQLIAGINKRVL